MKTRPSSSPLPWIARRLVGLFEAPVEVTFDLPDRGAKLDEICFADRASVGHQLGDADAQCAAASTSLTRRSGELDAISVSAFPRFQRTGEATGCLHTICRVVKGASLPMKKTDSCQNHRGIGPTDGFNDARRVLVISTRSLCSARMLRM